MPVFILSGIYLGWFSPTEAGGFACLYAILVARYVYRTMSWQAVLDAAIHSAMLTAQILVIVAAAGLFSWILTVNGVPAAIGNLLTALELKPWAFLMAVNLAIGMFTPPFGLNMFVAQSVLGIPLETIYRGVLPFVVVQIIALLIITYWPGLSLILTYAI